MYVHGFGTTDDHDTYNEVVPPANYIAPYEKPYGHFGAVPYQQYPGMNIIKHLFSIIDVWYIALNDLMSGYFLTNHLMQTH